MAQWTLTSIRPFSWSLWSLRLTLSTVVLTFAQATHVSHASAQTVHEPSDKHYDETPAVARSVVESGVPFPWLEEGARLTRLQADQLERTVDRTPFDIEARAKLIGFYDANGHRLRNVLGAEDYLIQWHRHVLWVIANLPASDLAGLPVCHFDRTRDDVAYRQARSLWLRHASKDEALVKVFSNAAEFFLFGGECEIAALFWKRCVAMDRDNPIWLNALAQTLLKRLFPRATDTPSRHSLAKSLLPDLVSFMPKRPFAVDHIVLVRCAAVIAFEAGSLELARNLAGDLLELVDRVPLSDLLDPADADFARHHGHLVLGLIAEKESHHDLARRHLMGAVQIARSSPVWQIPPNMSLAQALLDRHQVEAVREFLVHCLVRCREKGSLSRWIRTLYAGHRPDFGDSVFRW